MWSTFNWTQQPIHVLFRWVNTSVSSTSEVVYTLRFRHVPVERPHESTIQWMNVINEWRLMKHFHCFSSFRWIIPTAVNRKMIQLNGVRQWILDSWSFLFIFENHKLLGSSLETCNLVYFERKCFTISEQLLEAWLSAQFPVTEFTPVSDKHTVSDHLCEMLNTPESMYLKLRLILNLNNYECNLNNSITNYTKKYYNGHFNVI